MATKLGSRAGAAQIGPLMMLVSFVLVAGFLYWLSVTAKPTEIIPTEKREAATEKVVTFAAFSALPTNFLGDTIGLQNVRVGHAFGNHGRWINLQDANRNGYIVYFPDLVRMDSASFYHEITGGALVNLFGVVVETTDSVLEAWEAAGSFTAEVDRLVAASTAYLSFIDVAHVEPGQVPQPQDGSTN